MIPLLLSACKIKAGDVIILGDVEAHFALVVSIRIFLDKVKIVCLRSGLVSKMVIWNDVRYWVVPYPHEDLI